MDTATEIVTLGELFLQSFNAIWGVFHSKAPITTPEKVAEVSAIATAGSLAVVAAAKQAPTSNPFGPPVTVQFTVPPASPTDTPSAQ